MRNKGIKLYRIFIIALFVFIAIYVLVMFLGDRRSDDKTNDKSEEMQNMKYNNESEQVLSQDIKILEKYDTLFEWYDGRVPEVKEYIAGAKKNRKYLAYGVSKDQYEHMKKCYDEEVKYNNDNPLNEEYSGHGIYNKDSIIISNDEFERKYMSVSGEIMVEDIRTTLMDTQDNYFTKETRDMIINNLSDDRRSINNICVYNSADDKLCSNQKIYYVIINVRFKCTSRWVQDVLIAPKLTYLKDDGEKFTEYESPVYMTINGEKLSGYEYGIYLLNANIEDNYSLYDYDDENCRNSIQRCHWALRVGEGVSARIVYMIPAAYFEDTYLVYNDLEEFEKVDFTYNLKSVSMLSLERELRAFKTVN